MHKTPERELSNPTLSKSQHIRARAGLLVAGLASGLVACAVHGGAASDGDGADPAVSERSAPAILREIEGEPLFRVLPKDAIPAIDEPRFVSAEQGQEFMLPHEPVLGIVGVHGTPRAYSAWVLDRHEIVNDELDGRAVMPTW